MELELDLQTIRMNAELREDENYQFRSYLKSQSSDKIDHLVGLLYNRVVAEIDCTTCGNCCMELEICFTNEEIDRLSEYLSLNKEKFIDLNTRRDEFGEKDVYLLKSKPCQFLEDKKCNIYSIRPEVCQSYPNLHKNGFTSRLHGVISNYAICPIVYNVYELLKRELSFN